MDPSSESQTCQAVISHQDNMDADNIKSVHSKDWSSKDSDYQSSESLLDSDSGLGAIEVDTVHNPVHHNQLFAQSSVKLAYAKPTVPSMSVMESVREDRPEAIHNGAIVNSGAADSTQDKAKSIVHQVLIHAHTSLKLVDSQLEKVASTETLDSIMADTEISSDDNVYDDIASQGAPADQNVNLEELKPVHTIQLQTATTNDLRISIDTQTDTDSSNPPDLPSSAPPILPASGHTLDFDDFDDFLAPQLPMSAPPIGPPPPPPPEFDESGSDVQSDVDVHVYVATESGADCEVATIDDLLGLEDGQMLADYDMLYVSESDNTEKGTTLVEVDLIQESSDNDDSRIDIRTPQTSLDLRNALQTPFEMLEREFDESPSKEHGKDMRYDDNLLVFIETDENMMAGEMVPSEGNAGGVPSEELISSISSWSDASTVPQDGIVGMMPDHKVADTSHSEPVLSHKNASNDGVNSPSLHAGLISGIHLEHGTNNVVNWLGNMDGTQIVQVEIDTPLIIDPVGEECSKSPVHPCMTETIMHNSMPIEQGMSVGGNQGSVVVALDAATYDSNSDQLDPPPPPPPPPSTDVASLASSLLPHLQDNYHDECSDPSDDESALLGDGHQLVSQDVATHTNTSPIHLHNTWHESANNTQQTKHQPFDINDEYQPSLATQFIPSAIDQTGVKTTITQCNSTAEVGDAPPETVSVTPSGSTVIHVHHQDETSDKPHPCLQPLTQNDFSQTTTSPITTIYVESPSHVGSNLRQSLITGSREKRDTLEESRQQQQNEDSIQEQPCHSPETLTQDLYSTSILDSGLNQDLHNFITQQETEHQEPAGAEGALYVTVLNTGVDIKEECEDRQFREPESNQFVVDDKDVQVETDVLVLNAMCETVPSSSIMSSKSSFSTRPKTPLKSLPVIKPITTIRLPNDASVLPTNRSADLPNNPNKPLRPEGYISSVKSPFTKPVSSSQRPVKLTRKRSHNQPFQVEVLKGLLGLGIKVQVTPEGHVKVTEVTKSGPVGRNGNVL